MVRFFLSVVVKASMELVINSPGHGARVSSPVSVAWSVELDGDDAMQATTHDVCYAARGVPTSRFCTSLANAQTRDLELDTGEHLLDVWLGTLKRTRYFSVGESPDDHRKLELLRSANQFSKVPRDGVPVVVPAGFRCTVRIPLRERGVVGASMPFDNGFFSARAVLSVLQGSMLDDAGCVTKREDPTGLRFETKDCMSIRQEVLANGTVREDGTELVDKRRNFFILDKQHQFVQPHYAHMDDPQIPKATLNRRLRRFWDHCNRTMWLVHYQGGGFTDLEMRLDDSTENVRDWTAFQALSDFLKTNCPKAHLLLFLPYTVDLPYVFPASQYADFALYLQSLQ